MLKNLKLKVVFGTLLMLCLVAFMKFDSDAAGIITVGGVDHDTDNLAVTESGQWLGLDYVIYEDGLCIVTGTQTAKTSYLSSSSTHYGKSPWYQNSAVTSFYLDYKADGKSQQRMFCYASYVTNVSFGDSFDTSQVTDMSRMFEGCSSLTSLDLSSFNTLQVTTMGNMFGGCSSLTSLDLSNFNTSQVTKMYFLFYGCSSLTSLDLSNFNTSQVTTMTYMFSDCSALTSLDLSNFDTSRVTDMSEMFDDCSALTSLDLSNFDTSQVTDISWMFKGCSSLTSLDLSNFDTSQVTNMSNMFNDCPSLTSLDLSNFNTSQVTNMSNMFNDCSSLPSLDLSNFNTSQVTDMHMMFSGCSTLTSLDLSSFNTSQVTKMSWMVKGCSLLTSLDLSNFDTSQVIDMSYMFSDCSALTLLDLSNFNTSQVTDMSWMVEGCSELTSLDLSNFDTSKVTDTGFIFDGCSKIEQIKTPATNPLTDIPLPKTLYSHPDNTAYTKMPVTTGESITLYNWKDGVYDINGKEYVLTDATTTTTWLGLDVYIFDDGMCIVTGTQTEIADSLSNYSTYYGNSPWYKNSAVTSLYLDYKADGKSQDSMFRDASYATSILTGSNFDTSRVTNMHMMFSGCSKLTSLDLSNFNTSQVTTMTYMFSDCSALTSLDLSNFDTSRVTDMSSMFHGCSALTSLDVSSFNTSQVTDMSYIFDDCSSLTSVSISNFDTSKVINMSWMFYGCSALTSLDLSNFDTSQVTNMFGMFYGCSSIASLDLSNFDTSQVTTMSDMFNCSSLTSLNLSSFNTSQVTSMSGMFHCSSLTSLDLSRFNTSRVTNMSSMFHGCSALTSLDISNFNTSQVTDMKFMFKGCSSLTSLDLSNFNTSRVTDMPWMFDGCSSLASLNLSNFNTSQVTDMRYMFNGCSNLEQLKTPATNSLTDIALPKTLYYICKSYSSLPVTTGTSLTLTSTVGSHQYGEYISNNDGHDCIDGTKTATCTICGVTDTIADVGSAPGSHVYVNNETTYTDKTKTNFTASWSDLTVTVQNTNTATNSSTATYEMNIHLVSPKTVSVNSTITGGESGGFLGIGAKKSTTTIYLDGSQVTSYSGNQSNKAQSISVPAGDHVLKIVYLTQSSKTSNSLYKGVITLPAKEDIDVCTFCGATTDHNYVHTSTSHDNSTKEDILTHACEYCGKSYTERVSTAYTLKDGTVVDLGNNKGSGKWLGLDWFILQDGMCVVKGTQTGEVTFDDDSPNCIMKSPWHSNVNVLSFYLDYDASSLSQYGVFWDAVSVEEITFGTNFSTAGVTETAAMFNQCTSLTRLTLPENFSKQITNMSGMFAYCTSLKSIQLPEGFGQSVEDISLMFACCESLEELDLSSFVINESVSVEDFAVNCSSLKKITLGEGVAYLDNTMFRFVDEESGDPITLGTPIKTQVIDNSSKVALTVDWPSMSRVGDYRVKDTLKGYYKTINGNAESMSLDDVRSLDSDDANVYSNMFNADDTNLVEHCYFVDLETSMIDAEILTVECNDLYGYTREDSWKLAASVKNSVDDTLLHNVNLADFDYTFEIPYTPQNVSVTFYDYDVALMKYYNGNAVATKHILNGNKAIISTKANLGDTDNSTVYTIASILTPKFTITVPTSITLDEDGTGEYEVTVNGSFTSGTISVTPETSFTLSQNGKTDINVNITQDKTAFTAGETAIGHLSAQDVSAGEWRGNFALTVSMTE